MPATMSKTSKEPHKFSSDSTQGCKHHLQYQFSEWIGRHGKCIHKTGKEVMKSNKEPFFKPQAPLTTSTLIGHSPTTSDATIVTSIMKTEFSTSITNIIAASRNTNCYQHQR
jgi:hypothetical protein